MLAWLKNFALWLASLLNDLWQSFTTWVVLFANEIVELGIDYFGIDLKEYYDGLTYILDVFMNFLQGLDELFPLSQCIVLYCTGMATIWIIRIARWVKAFIPTISS